MLNFLKFHPLLLVFPKKSVLVYMKARSMNFLELKNDRYN